jgi:hypothetical protein
MFNESISALELIEIPLKGRRYTGTWSDKQGPHLLGRLDWFFISVAWATNYPNTLAHSLAMETLDHVPCVVTIGTDIPNA